MCTIFGMLIPLLGTYPREITVDGPGLPYNELFQLRVKGRFYESACGNLLCVLNKHRHTEESGDGEVLVAAGGSPQCKNPGGALPGRRACGVITEVRRGEIHK